MAELESGVPASSRFQPRRSSFDYVYETDKRSDLRGKHSAAKSAPHPPLLRRPPGLASRAHRAGEVWKNAASWSPGGMSCTGRDDMEQGFLLEKRAIRRAFDAYFALRMRGLAIRAGG